MISNRHGKANNSYMDDEYNDKQATKYITYLDANNLYGWALCKPLPTHGFKWMDDEELTSWKKTRLHTRSRFRIPETPARSS